MKKFVIADIHGNHKGLLECLKKSSFDYDEDKLIVLGDTVDGLFDVRECFDELLKIKNTIHVLGNHDDWAIKWYDREPIYKNNSHVQPDIWWTCQGGENTLMSYGYKEMDETHLEFLLNSCLYHVEEVNGEKYLFVHGGINPNQKDMNKQKRVTLIWDRDLVQSARKKNNQRPDYKYGGWDLIFVGHTTTQHYGQTEPLKLCNVIMMDTGAGWDGRLSIMDLETKEFWQSDFVRQMYPLGGRG